MKKLAIFFVMNCVLLICFSGCKLWSGDPTDSPVGPSDGSGISEGIPGVNFNLTLKQKPDSYIVTFKKEVSDLSLEITRLEKLHGLKVGNRYSFALKGFAAVIPPGKVEILKADPNVAGIEPDLVVTTCNQSLPWGIDKIDADLSPTALAGNGSGAVTGVKVYVIDTGIQLTHPDLNVSGGVDFTGVNGTGDDGNGHGTHVSGIIAARDDTGFVVGVAPGAELYAVKVLDNSGSGYFSWVIAGVDFVTQQKLANPLMPVVANMSLGSKTSTTFYNSLDIAVRNSILSGVVYSIAAGNSKMDAKFFSPAHVLEAITVGAYDQKNVFASFSNYGPYLDINAPGVNILSTYMNSGTISMSGTSMAAPHAAGAAVLALATNPTMTPTQVRDSLVSTGQAWVNVKKPSTTKLSVYVKTY